MSNLSNLHDLLDRLSRLHGAGMRTETLNPTQAAALSYLSRANRFSRAPSHVAAYLAATRGTVSQTLKALARKGFVTEVPSPSDRRSVAYNLTADGTAALIQDADLLGALRDMDAPDREGLERGAQALLREMLARTGDRGFGLCGTCRHHRSVGDRRHCALLDVPLAAAEAEQICYEHCA